MGTKRLGWARIKSLINEQGNHPDGARNNWVLSAASGSVDGAMQGPTTVIIGKSGQGVDPQNYTQKPAVADPHRTGTTKLWELGTKLVYGEREFRYAQNGAATPGAGLLVQQAIALHATRYRDMAVATAAIGATTIVATVGGDTDCDENYFADGYVHVNDGTGEGLVYKIKSHNAVDASADTDLTLVLCDPLNTVLTNGNSTVSVTPNKFRKVIVAPATTPLTGMVVGVAPVTLAAGEYFWCQVKGPSAVHCVGTLVIGDNVCHAISGGTAGTVVPVVADSAAQRVARTLGQVMLVLASTEKALIDLAIE